MYEAKQHRLPVSRILSPARCMDVRQFSNKYNKMKQSLHGYSVVQKMGDKELLNSIEYSHDQTTFKGKSIKPDVSYVKYEAGKIRIRKFEGNKALSDNFSGCLMAVFNINKHWVNRLGRLDLINQMLRNKFDSDIDSIESVRYVAHVSTDQNPNLDCKKQFLYAMSNNAFVNVLFFRPGLNVTQESLKELIPPRGDRLDHTFTGEIIKGQDNRLHAVSYLGENENLIGHDSLMTDSIGKLDLIKKLTKNNDINDAEFIKIEDQIKINLAEILKGLNNPLFVGSPDPNIEYSPFLEIDFQSCEEKIREIESLCINYFPFANTTELNRIVLSIRHVIEQPYKVKSVEPWCDAMLSNLKKIINLIKIEAHIIGLA